ncbi:hypothetical protein A5656_05595 [Mycobacterium gordonae]|nr:hypothetical protein [Mycobacterium gordonae]OBK44706.1 hypothetical protein A5656_05595 [Mycobacterium gordonae]
MTAEILDEASPNVAVFVLAWLRELGPVDITRPEGGPLPFRLVNVINEADDIDEGLSVATFSVHTFAAATDGVDADTMALREGDITHRRMQYLAKHPSTDVVLPDGRIVNPDFLDTIEKPAWRNYQDDSISRVKAVYRVGLSFAPVP